MRKSGKQETTPYLAEYPPPVGLFNLPRAIVIPTSIHSPYPSRFLIIFGNGHFVRSNRDFIITWDRRQKQFLYMPFKVFCGEQDIVPPEVMGFAVNVDRATRSNGPAISKKFEFSNKDPKLAKDRFFDSLWKMKTKKVKAVRGLDTIDVRVSVERWFNRKNRIPVRYGLDNQYYDDPIFELIKAHPYDGMLILVETRN